MVQIRQDQCTEFPARVVGRRRTTVAGLVLREHPSELHQDLAKDWQKMRLELDPEAQHASCPTKG